MEDILKSPLFEAFATASESVYIYVCDMKTNMSRWSPNAVQYFNLPGEYVEDAGSMWGERIHPKDRDIYQKDISAVFEGRSAHHDCQYRAINRYGDYVWLECKGSVIQDENGEPAVFAGLMTRLDNQNKYDPLTNQLTIYEFHKYDFNDRQGGILLIGIDEFRKVISNYGYSFGDEVLVEISKRIAELCTHGERIYRFAGDEFLIILPDGDKDRIKQLFQKLSDELERTEVMNKEHISISISGGAVLYPENGIIREGLLNKLEHSLEHAKSNCRGSIVFFSQEIADIHKRIKLVKEDLLNSMRKDFKGFELYFQPWIAPESQSIGGCEALLRWQGEVIKDSYPGEFIKILETDGSIRQVGMWVMKEAMRQQKEWQQRYKDIYVSFNVSYQQFMDETFVDAVIDTANEYEVKKSSIIIELTESCRVEDPENLAAMFSRLRAEGFKMALDDFGTGYASLEMLKILPVDYIKIEHSFVQKLSEEGHDIDYAIIENLLHLCGKLKYKSVVEGVENQKVAKIIQKMDSTYMQGYYYSRPVCRKEFEQMLQENGCVNS